MAKALIITRHYLDEQLGGPNCSKAFVRAIAELYDDCTLIYPEHNDHKTDLFFLKNTKVKLKPCQDRRNRLKKCLDMYIGKIHRFGALAKKELQHGRYDIVFIDHSFIAAAGIIQTARKYAGKVVTLHHNVEKEYIKDNQQSILFRLPYNHFSLKAEKNAVRLSDVNLTLTADDAQTFAAEYPEKAGTFHVMGMFLYDDEKTVQSSQETGNVFVISGSLGALQTETAMLEFLSDCLPALNKACPDNQLIITGRNPSQRLLSVCRQSPNITLIPNPKDIFKEIRKANYYIAPINTGGGLKLRIMDGLRLGLPVIAHEVSVRGYEPIIADGFMYSYSDSASFETALKKLLENTGCTHQKVAQSFLNHFSFNAGKQRLGRILQE